MRAGYYLLKNDKSVYVFNNIKYFECVAPSEISLYLCSMERWKSILYNVIL